MLPLFDYCDNVWPWSVCIKQDSHRLETLLNFACRTVLRKCRNYSASSARKELGISTLSVRQKVHLAQTVYKCLALQSPTYLNNLLSTPASHYKTRASSTSQLNLIHIFILPLARRHLVSLAHHYGDHYQIISDAVQTFGCSQNYMKNTF